MKKSAYIGPKLSRYQFEGLKNRGWIIEYASEVYKRHPNIVALIELDIGQYQRMVVKNFGWRDAKSPLLSPFIISPARKAWNASHQLIDAGVPVPKPIAVHTARQAGFIDCNYYISEYVGKHEKASRYLGSNIVSLQKKTLIVKKIGEIIFKMHNAGFIHNDLVQDNFLVVEGNCEKIFLVDVNRVQKKSKITNEEKMLDIARLNLCCCDLEQDHDNCLWLYLLVAYDSDNAEQNLSLLKKALKTMTVKNREKNPEKSKTK